MSILLHQIGQFFFFARARARKYRSAIVAFLFILPVSLGAAPSKSSPSKSISELKSSDGRKKFAAIDSLGKQRGAEVKAALREALQSEQDPLAKMALIDSLIQNHDSAAVPLLIRLLQDPNPAVRHRAVLALANLGGPGVTTALESAAQDNALKVRLAAIRGLAHAGDASAVNSLERLKNDKNTKIRMRAKAAIDAINQRKALPKR